MHFVLRQCSPTFTKNVFRSRHRLTVRWASTARESPSLLNLSQSLDQNRKPARDSSGPFPLGLSATGRSQQAKLKPWSELSPAGKVMRGTARTTNLTVILFGAGVFALITYSLTTELFSKNSPTVLYDEACTRLQASAKLGRYLHGPLTFHTTAPSNNSRPRHRNRTVPSQIMVDSAGREHMIMSFYVQGRLPGAEPTPSDSSYLDGVLESTKEKLSTLSNLTLDDSVVWGKQQALDTWQRWKRIFKYVSGSSLPALNMPAVPAQIVESKTDASGTWSFAGMFSGLRGRSTVTSYSEPIGTTYTDGEVHVDLVRNDEGYFVFRYLLVDIPNTRARHPIRVFIEKAPGVRTDEPVVRWFS